MVKKTKKSTSRRSSSPRSVRRMWPSFTTILLLTGLLLGVIVTFVASQRSTELRQRASNCSPNSCNQCQNGNYWQIVNQTNCPAEPDGDIQLCNTAGRIGLCGGAQYCCPAPGQHWTTNMSACAHSVYSGPCISPV